MRFHLALNPRRIARSLVTVLVLTLIETVVAPVVLPGVTTPQSHAVTGSLTATSSTSRSFITIPAGVETIAVTIYGAGGGKGGNDGNSGGTGGAAGFITAVFTVSPGDVVALFPGNAGSSGKDSGKYSDAATTTTEISGGGKAGDTTVQQSYFNVDGTYYSLSSLNFGGAKGGSVGQTGSSGGGGGGGAASVVAINSSIVAVAAGAGGGGGAAASASGTDGSGAGSHTSNSPSTNGTAGAASGSGNTCTSATTDGGGGGGGGGGWYGGVGGQSVLVGGECAGRGGSRGNNFVSVSALSSTSTYWNPSASPGTASLPQSGRIDYSYDVKASTACAPTSQVVDIYTVLRFEASIDCTWSVPATVSVIDIFAVGGGGGGGGDGGTGGGGGGTLLRTAVPVNPGSSTTIRVGYGGNGGLHSSWFSASGETSTLTTSTGSVYFAPGGGAGGTRANAGGSGGTSPNNGTFAGGAGGIAPSGSGFVGGAGNYGVSNYFYGTPNTYAGGGGGGCYYDSLSDVTGAVGRNGGGNGCSNTAASGQLAPGNGTAGTGGGGGGGGAGGAGRVLGGKGGSGVILIRYATNSANAFPASLTSALAGRWTPDGLQLLDSSRKGWIDSSGTNASVSNSNITSTGLSITTQGTSDGANSTGSTKSLLTVQGTSSSKITFQNLNTGYTLFHVARYVTGGNNRRLFSAKDSNWLSGFYYGVGVAHHAAWLTNDSRIIDYKWQLSADQAVTFRSNGVDYTKNDDAIGTQATSATNFGINNWTTTGEESDFQVAEVLVFNRSLTIGEMRLLEEYLARVDGLSLSQYHDTTETDTAYLGTSTYSYMYMQYDARNNLNDTFTVEAWLKPDSVCNTNVCTYFAREGQIRLVDRNGKLGFILYGDGSWEWVYDVAPLPSGEWHHVAVAKTLPGNNNNSVKVYLDGKLVYTKAGSPYRTSTTAVATPSNSSTLAQVTTWSYIGVVSGGGERWYGNVDEFKVWKVARNESEISGDMYSNDRYDPNMQMYFNMNYVSGTHINQFKIPNLAYYGHGRSDLYNWDSDVISFSDVKTVTTSGPYTTITFPRAYITQYGGWKATSGISQVQAVVVAGGGGGGGGYEGGGGGAGGFIETLTSISAGTIYPISVGTGGRGTSYPLIPTNGDSTTAFGLNVLGGGSGTVEFNDGGVNRQYTNTSGGSGGGGSWSTYMSGAAGASNQGNSGGSSYLLDNAACGSGNTVFAGGGGGGAGAVGQDATCLKGGNGGAGKASTVLGTTVAAGGGGSLRPYTRTITSAVQGLGGNGGGGNSAYTDGAIVGGSGGATNGTYGTGSGGGAGYAMNGYSGVGGNGGTGVVALRYITALVPSYTKPSIAYLDVGQTETFTTNVLADSATAGLTRTFKWESSTTGAIGPFSQLKVGTGANNAAFSWIPSDTSTSGSQYLYRLTVTDSDTAGLFITDSSTAYAVINPAMVINSTITSSTLKKRINVSRNETFTITLGTPTYMASLYPVIPGVTLDTSTAGTVIFKIADTATIGTWLETLTVTDSVAASIDFPLTLIISPPPLLTYTAEVAQNGQVFAIDFSSTASYDRSTGAIRDISGSNRTVTAVNGLSFSDSSTGTASLKEATNQYLKYTNTSQLKQFTIEAYIRVDTALNGQKYILTSQYTGANINYALGLDSGLTVFVGYHRSGWKLFRTSSTLSVGTWTHITGVWDGNEMQIYFNGVKQSGGFDNTVSGADAPLSDGTDVYINRAWNVNAAMDMTVGFIRVYNRGLSATELVQNYNASKYRFASSSTSLLVPSTKYGTSILETFTATSGQDTRTVTFAVGDRSGVDWDTSTVINQIRLSLQESLTPGTYFDTMTVTDTLGQSTYLPFSFKVAKADTLTVYVDTPTALNYTGSQANFTPTIKSLGAVGLESGTAFSAPIRFKPGGTSCATGGYCRVGDIGPAGGVIFIDTSTASSDGRIYEAAPQNWTGSDDLASIGAFCIGTAASANITNGSQVGIGWGDTLTANFDAGCTGGAVQVAADLVLNGYSDWFVPSENEGVQLIAARNQAGLLQIGNTWTTGNWGYWTSTESSASVVRIMGNVPVWGIGNGDKGQALKFMLRPVRAFKPCWAIDTCTSLSTTDTPTSAGLYNMVPTTLSNAADLLTKYTNVVYSTTNLTINRVAPSSVTIPWINTNYPDTFTINFTSTAGNQTIRYSTTNGTASGCALDYKKIYTTSQGTCFVTITRAGDRNFLPDTITATIFFLAWVNSQPTNQVGSGNTIAINGVTSYSVDTTTPPSITTLSTTLLSLGSGGTFTINGTGFGASGLTVKFWRNKVVTPTGSTATTITFNVSDIGSSGATTGRIAVTTVNGQDFSTDTLTITP
jgi:hypothetical protein